MPHVSFEYSTNINLPIEHAKFLANIHNTVSELCNAPLSACMSRVSPIQNFYIEDGDTTHAFAHIQIKLLSGRDKSIRNEVSKQCHSLLIDYLSPHAEGLTLRTSVEVTEMERETYTH